MPSVEHSAAPSESSTSAASKIFTPLSDVALGLCLVLFFVCVGSMAISVYRTSLQHAAASQPPAQPQRPSTEVDVEDVAELEGISAREDKLFSPTIPEDGSSGDASLLPYSMRAESEDQSWPVLVVHPKRPLRNQLLSVFGLGNSKHGNKVSLEPLDSVDAKYSSAHAITSLPASSEAKPGARGWQRFLPTFFHRAPLPPIPSIIVHPSDGSPAFPPHEDNHPAPRSAVPPPQYPSLPPAPPTEDTSSFMWFDDGSTLNHLDVPLRVQSAQQQRGDSRRGVARVGAMSRPQEWVAPAPPAFPTLWQPPPESCSRRHHCT